MSKTIVLKNRPEEKPKASDFAFVDQDTPEPGSEEMVLEVLYVSVDPYLRGRMRDEKSYIEPFQLDQPIMSSCVAEVLESNHPKFKKGEFVSGMMPWKKIQVSDGKNVYKVDKDRAPLSAYLGILGITGLTAYFGLTEIGKPQKGETLVVSGAAGAVGSTAGQIGKIKGCKVIGIAGTDEKINLITNTFGFDAGINYNSTGRMGKAVKERATDGVDVYFDNVGGEITDGVLENINTHARIVACGAISLYNKKEVPTGPRIETKLIKNSALIQGFIVSNYQDRFQEGMTQLANWLQEEKLTYEETVMEGFDNIPDAFIGLFEGKNKGKMIVKI